MHRVEGDLLVASLGDSVVRVLAWRLESFPFLKQVDFCRILELVNIAQLILLLLGFCDALEVLCSEHEILLDKLEVLLKAVDLRDDPFQI